MELRERRRRLGMSLARLAARAGVSRVRLAACEGGELQLTDEERDRITAAFREEVARLQEALASTLEDSVA